MATNPALSIIVPVFNEEGVVGAFIEAIWPHVERAFTENGLSGQAEIIFVDDGSSDATVLQIQELAALDHRIKLVKLSKNFGKDAALTAGLSYATGDAVIPMDVDLQDPPEILVDMVRLWKDGAKIVNAVRANRDTDSALKRLTSGWFYRFYNRISKNKIDVNVGDYRLLDKQVVDTINCMPERIRFMKGIFSWVGFSKKSVEYIRAGRVAGTSKWRYWGLWNFALDGITGATTMPLRIWTYVGLVAASLSFLFACYIIVKTMVTGVDVPGYASLMVVVLFLGGLNMMALGIIGEYIGRISIEVRQRPIYLVEDTINIKAPRD